LPLRPPWTSLARPLDCVELKRSRRRWRPRSSLDATEEAVRHPRRNAHGGWALTRTVVWGALEVACHRKCEMRSVIRPEQAHACVEHRCSTSSEDRSPLRCDLSQVQGPRRRRSDRPRIARAVNQEKTSVQKRCSATKGARRGCRVKAACKLRALLATGLRTLWVPGAGCQ